MLKKLFSHTLLYALGPQVPKIANIFLLPLITASLTPLDYGVYGTIMAYNGLFLGLRMLGFDILFVNTFYKHKKTYIRFWNRYTGILIVWQHIYVGIYIYFLALIIPEEVGDNKWLLILLIIVPSYFYGILNSIAGRYLQIAQKPLRIFITTAISGTVTVIVTYICIVEFKMGYLGWYISAAAGSTIIFSSYVGLIVNKVKIRPIFRVSKHFLREAFRVALPTIPHNYSSYLLNSSDRLVMDNLQVDVNDIGRYNMAYIIGNYFEIFGTAVGMAVNPIFTMLYSDRTKKSDRLVRELSVFLQLGFLLLACVASLWAKEMFQFLVRNKELSEVYYIAIIIIMSYSYRPMFWVATGRLFFEEKTNRLWRISFIGGIGNLLLNFIFIPIYGYEVAAVTTMISLLYLGFSGFFLKEFRELESEKYRPILWLLLIVGLTILIYLIKEIDVIFKAFLTIAMLVGFYGYFMRKKEVLRQIRI